MEQVRELIVAVSVHSLDGGQLRQSATHDGGRGEQPAHQLEQCPAQERLDSGYFCVEKGCSRATKYLTKDRNPQRLRASFRTKAPRSTAGKSLINEIILSIN